MRDYPARGLATVTRVGTVIGRRWPLSRLAKAISAVAAVSLLTACGTSSSSPQTSRGSSGNAQVRLTWISIANWLVEVGNLRVLIDAYYTRPPAPVGNAPASPLFTGKGTLGLDYTTGPMASDQQAVSTVLNAIDYKHKKISYILAGHSNFDHDPDAPLVAQMTGAQIIGPPSTCYQAEAEGIPQSQCRPVNGGEAIPLSADVTVYVAHINHSGDNTSSDLHSPAELTSVPKVSPATTAGGLRWGILEDMPNGGGGRGYLFKVKGSGGQSLSFTYQDTGSAYDFDKPLLVNGTENFGTPSGNWQAVMAESGLRGVNLWIEGADPALAALELPILHPQYYVPTHWDGLWAPFLKGMPMAFKAPGGWEALLAGQGVKGLYPQQYMDSWVLDGQGLRAVSNHAVKQSLGFPDVQPF